MPLSVSVILMRTVVMNTFSTCLGAMCVGGSLGLGVVSYGGCPRAAGQGLATRAHSTIPSSGSRHLPGDSDGPSWTGMLVHKWEFGSGPVSDMRVRHSPRMAR